MARLVFPARLILGPLATLALCGCGREQEVMLADQEQFGATWQLGESSGAAVVASFPVTKRLAYFLSVSSTVRPSSRNVAARVVLRAGPGELVRPLTEQLTLATNRSVLSDLLYLARGAACTDSTARVDPGLRQAVEMTARREGAAQLANEVREALAAFEVRDCAVFLVPLR